MYMMYQPPDTGVGVQWVPLQLVTWRWQTSGSKSVTSSLFSPDPPNGSVTADSPIPFPGFPNWIDFFPESH